MPMILPILNSVIDEMLKHAGALDKLEINNCILIHIKSRTIVPLQVQTK